MNRLRHLNFERTSIKELPNSIRCLEALEVLFLNFTPIKELPYGIGCLEALTHLFVNGC